MSSLETVAMCVSMVDRLLMAVYGDWKSLSNDFPTPLAAVEAGPSPSGQRRYLWTDAFAVMTFVSQAKVSKLKGDEATATAYLNAADRLIDAVCRCLGRPRDDSGKYPMAIRENSTSEQLSSENGYKGLRIGKCDAKSGDTDLGMKYDGIYWHYIDKFILAVSRYAYESHSLQRMVIVVQLIQDLHPVFFIPQKGYLWKINCDCTRVSGGSDTRPNHDTLSAWIVYNIAYNTIVRLRAAENTAAASAPAASYWDTALPAIKAAIDDLTPIVQSYIDQVVAPSSVFQSRAGASSVSNITNSRLMQEVSDPLGLGCHLITMQWCRTGSDVFNETSLKLYRGGIASLALMVMQQEAAESSQSDRHKRLYEPVKFREYGGLMGLQLMGERKVDKVPDSNDAESATGTAALNPSSGPAAPKPTAESACCEYGHNMALKYYREYFSDIDAAVDSGAASTTKRTATHAGETKSINLVMLAAALNPIAFLRDEKADGSF